MRNWKTCTLAIAGILAAAAPGAAGATVINFDVDGLGNPIAANTSITTQYANLGVTFLGLEESVPININAAPDPDGDLEPSSPNVLTNCSDASTFCPGNRADGIRIFFASGASDISLQLNSLGSGSITFNLYDVLDNLLETQTLSSPSGTYIPVIFAASGVTRIDGLQPNDSWAWAMDDLSFNGAAVPEPSTWAMMLLGFGAVGFALRRRKQVAATKLRTA
jgi:hypothetical protein